MSEGRGALSNPPIRSAAIITSIAYSLTNFRGPLIQAMIAAGVRVHALAPDYDEVTRAAVRELGAIPIDYYLQRAGMDPAGDLRALVSLTRILRRERPDLTLSYFVKPAIYGSIAARLAGVPNRYALVAGLGYAFSDDGNAGSWRRWVARKLILALYRLSLTSCRRVFFQNDTDVDDLVAAGAIRPAQAARVNGTGIDLDRFAYAPPPVDPPTFLLAARLLREKGVTDFVEAARRVRAQVPTARFILLGDSDANPHTIPREMVAGWVREGVVEWPGQVTDVRPWLAAASVFVLPSYYREGVPRSIQEAMAMGRPVITTDTPGCRDTVIAGETGLLVPVRDPSALAAAMLRFVAEPELIGAMGRAGRRLAETRFDVRAINRRMLAVLGIAGG